VRVIFYLDHAQRITTTDTEIVFVAMPELSIPQIG